MYQEYVDDSDYDDRYARKNEWIKREMEDKAEIALDKLSKAVHPQYLHIFADLLVENYHTKLASNIAKSLDIQEDEIFSLDKDDYSYKKYLKDRVIERVEDYANDYEVEYMYE